MFVTDNDFSLDYDGSDSKKVWCPEGHVLKEIGIGCAYGSINGMR